MGNKMEAEEATEVKASSFFNYVQMISWCFPPGIPMQIEPTCAVSEKWRLILIFLCDS